MSKYYNIADDLKQYPDAWAYLAIGARSTGKTYGALLDCYQQHKKFVFIKRTIEDVNLLCTRGKMDEYMVDLSPFKPINRDHGSEVEARTISSKGIGGFFEYDTLIGYILALSAVVKFKGFDLSECDEIIFDEFVPQPWERINKKEGDQLLDLYKTVARDREARGRPPLKLVCLANAVSISSPVCDVLELTDKIADMQARGQDVYYKNGIFLRLLKSGEVYEDQEGNTLFYQSMYKTTWGRMAFGNEFAYDDVSKIGTVPLKGYICKCAVKYKENVWYLYKREGRYYMTFSRSDRYKRLYDLSIEGDQKAFNIDHRIDMIEKIAQNKAVFESYTMYDVIVRFTKYFTL